VAERQGRDALFGQLLIARSTGYPDGRFIYALDVFYGSNQPGSTLWTLPLQQSGKIMGLRKQIGQGMDAFRM